MNKKRILCVLIFSLCLLASVFAQTVVERSDKPYIAKTVILHTNDVHGAIEGYAYIPTLRSFFEDQGANVFVVDAGDYSQGTTYVSLSKGLNAITMMNAAGYDIATLGNHEFDYGYAQLVSNLKQADFMVLCNDVLDADFNTIYYPAVVVDCGYGLKVGFIGVETPETQTKANPAYIKGLNFLAEDELYVITQNSIDSLKAQGADLIVALTHLGIDSSSEPNTSYDLFAHTDGIDFIIDAHSHTVMEKGPNGEPMQSTGTAFANIGVVVIDNLSKQIESNYLIPTETLEKDPAVSSMAQEIINGIKKEYGQVFATSQVELNGSRDPGNRTMETNLGDLITDALRWFVTKDEGSVKVPAENVLVITNGGGIRAGIPVGDVTRQDINAVLPFGNTVTTIYVKGSDVLEALEASTYCTPVALGGFPQVSGINFTVDTSVEYNANSATYPDSTYYGPASIGRVTINDVNGYPFDPEATYAVITNNFVAAGGDTYYVFGSAVDQFDTGVPLDEVVMQYVQEVLGGVIGQQYENPQGRITIY